MSARMSTHMSIGARNRLWRAPLAWGLGALALVVLAGCGPVKLIANTNIPTMMIGERIGEWVREELG